MQSTKTPFIAAAALFAAALLLAPRGAAAQPREHHATLEGTWEVQATFVNCDTGAPVAPPFTSLHAYLGTNGGSMIEQGSRTGPPPTASRTVGQGVWQRVKGRRFGSVFKFFRFDAAGVYIGGNEIETTLDLGTKGNTFVAASAGFAFDTAGSPVGPPICVDQTAKRMKLDG